MATKKERANRQAKRERARARQLEKERQAELDADQEVDETLSGDVIPEPETVEKDMGETYMPMGPTSWEEMDAMKAAREQASHIREATWNTQDLVYNILGHPTMKPNEKADAMKKVADGFGARVSGMMAEHEKMMKKDLDILVIESILAYDKRHAGPLEFIGDWISKAKLTASAENALSDEQFALVVEQDGKKERKYPIHDKAHVRNALARAAQMMAEGGEAADHAKAAMPKIRAAAKKMGIEMSMDKERNAILIEKDQNGDWRWIGWVTNNFIDWDGEIIAEDAHKEYVEWLETNPDLYPVSTTWHIPQMTRKNKVDFATYESGFLIMSGKLTEDEAEGLLKAKALTDLGMSHGSFALARDPEDERVITKYRMYECSDLPLENAANPFTDFEVVSKEADMKTLAEKANYLAQFFGGDIEKATSYLDKAGLKKEALDAAGIESKEKQEETPAAPATPETPAAPVAPAAQPPAMDMDAILKAVGEKFGMDDLGKAFAELQEAHEKVPVLEALIKDLTEKLEEQQGDIDEKIAEKIAPPAALFPWMQKARASQSEENIPDQESEKTIKSRAPGLPEGAWLNEATGTTPVPAQ